jgi:hypothetical protein
MGLPLSEQFMKDHRESISTCFIEAGKAGVRLPSGVQLPPLSAPDVPTNGQAPGSSTTEDVALAPQDRPPADPSANGAMPANGIANGTVVPSPTTIPTGWPSGGVAIVDLKPVQLAMLISKTAALLHGEERDRWVPLLSALQAERGKRMAQGRKPRRPDPDPIGHVEVEEG